MDMSEIIGWLAASLVLSTFCMRSMIALRSVAILSNLAFIAYASTQGFLPALALHIVLLPLNSIELLRLLKERSAEAQPS